MSEHTPGPWIAYNVSGNKILNNWRVRSESIDQPCGICRMDESLTGDQEVANAHLIAAAPELLSALKGMMVWARRVNVLTPGPEVAAALEAIWRAQGGRAEKVG